MSIRAWLLLLILFATLIPVLVGGIQFFERRDAEIAAAERDVTASAQHIAQVVQDTVRATGQLHYGLSRARDLDTQDRGACSDFLAEVLKEYPQYTGILTIKPDGDLFCDSLHTGGQTNFADRRYFQNAFKSRNPLVVEPVFGRLTGRAVLQVAYAVRRDNGEPAFVLLASLDLEKYMQSLAKSLPREGGVIAIIDGKGTILTWHPDGEELRATSIAESPLFGFARESHGGDAREFTEVGGVSRIWVASALAEFPEAGLHVLVGVSKANLLAAANRNLGQALSVLVVVSLLVFAGAWVLVELAIRRHAARIIAAVARFSGGDFGARIGTPYPRGEIGGLMAAMDHAFGSMQAQQDVIQGLNADLERRVAKRTAQLEAINQELESTSDAAIQRNRELTRAQEDLRRTEGFLNSLFEHIPIPISVKDAHELRYVRLNRAFEDLVGHPRSDMLGRTQQEFFGPDEVAFFTAKEREAIARLTLIDIPEALVQTATRGVRIVHSRKLPILDEHGVPQYVLTIGEDITERKESERVLASAKLEAERANRAKSDFLSRMSHDLRTPLNAILGFAQLLESDRLDAEQHDSVRHILKGGAHLLELINEVLDLARIESGHLLLSPEPVAVAEIVHHVLALVRPLATQRGITLDDDLVHACDDRHVLADRQRFNQILMNLLSNAVKYNREGGRVQVTCEDVPEGRVRIKVTDTGAGIPPDQVMLLFQPFERLGSAQSAIEGTGLGLALSKALAEAMGGTLGVASEVDRGSTFWVELAQVQAPAEAEAPAGARPAVSVRDPGVTGTVLYIEDNLSNQRLMERLLARRPGVRLVAAANGQAGFDVARADRPDLILLDLHLPDMPGDEVLRRLREGTRTRAIPVAVLSADATPSQARRLLAAGACAYLTKPLDIHQVLQLLDERLEQHS